MSSGKPSLDALRIDRSALPAHRSNGWVWVVLVLLLIGGGVAWFWFGRKPAPEVKTMVVEERSASSSGPRVTLNASGYVTARRAATVSSKVTGKVVEIVVEEGMIVQPGQLLAKLDASNVEASHKLAKAQLDSARSALAETRSNLELAEKELKRQATLADTQAGSRADHDR